MRPRRTYNTNRTAVLPRDAGGTEDNDLWFYLATDSKGNDVVCTVWEPTDEERLHIATGSNIRLQVWTPLDNIFPTGMDVTDESLGRVPTSSE